MGADDLVHEGEVTFTPGETAVSAVVVPDVEPGDAGWLTVAVTDEGGATTWVTLPDWRAPVGDVPGPVATTLPNFETSPVVAVTTTWGPNGELVGLDIEGIGAPGAEWPAIRYRRDERHGGRGQADPGLEFARLPYAREGEQRTA